MSILSKLRFRRKAQPEESPPKLREALDDILVAHAHAENRKTMEKIRSEISQTVDRILGLTYPIKDIEYHPPSFGIGTRYGERYSFTMAGTRWDYYPVDVEGEDDKLYVRTPKGRPHGIRNPVDLYRVLDEE